MPRSEKMTEIFKSKWFIVSPPFGDGTWIRAFAEDQSGTYLVDCMPFMTEDQGGLSHEQASELAKYLVELHNNRLSTEK